jgi:hypothetical protein
MPRTLVHPSARRPSADKMISRFPCETLASFICGSLTTKTVPDPFSLSQPLPPSIPPPHFPAFWLAAHSNVLPVPAKTKPRGCRSRPRKPNDYRAPGVARWPHRSKVILVNHAGQSAPADQPCESWLDVTSPRKDEPLQDVKRVAKPLRGGLSISTWQCRKYAFEEGTAECRRRIPLSDSLADAGSCLVNLIKVAGKVVAAAPSHLLRGECQGFPVFSKPAECLDLRGNGDCWYATSLESTGTELSSLRTAYLSGSGNRCSPNL